MKTIHFLNLTNGLLDYHNFPNSHLIRIQSTWCEQKRWNEILLDLDYDFLFNLAIGNQCIIHDYSAKKQIPRALYQGVTFIKFALEKFWFGHSSSYIIKKGNGGGCNCKKYFEENFEVISKQTKRKLKYLEKFLLINLTFLKIYIIADQTDKDGNSLYFNQLIHSVQENDKND